MPPFLHYVHRAAERAHLSADEACAALSAVLAGEAPPVQIAAWVTALRMKGETASELVGFARAMRSFATPIPHGLPPGEPLLDTCGTGGDGAGTFNISTLAALVVAGAGVRVAKHGNRSISSQCGSADVFESLGVKIPMPPDLAARAIREIGIGFLFAPAVHTAMKHVQPVRVELKMRTVFNLLGPLSNPAGASAQLVGAPSPQAAALMAEALAQLGLPRGFVVHGSDGLDEITTTGPTTVYEVRPGQVVERVVTPEDFGVAQAAPEALRARDREENFAIARAVLEGERGPRREIVLVNASAALVAAGAATDFRDGMARAAQSLDSGAALAKARALAALS